MINTSDHIGDDIYFLEGTSKEDLIPQPYLANKLMLMLCISGYAKGTIDLKEFKISKANLLIVLPLRIVQLTELSPNFKALIIITSNDYAQSMQRNEAVDIWMRILSNPIVRLTDNEASMMAHFFKIVRNIIRAEGYEHKLEAIRKLYEAMYYIGMDFEDIKNHFSIKNKSRQEKVFDEFYTALTRFHRQSREVQFYADKLCLTPKYMSNIIKDLTGRSALEWINNYMTLEAKAMLSSNPKMSIQEVAAYLGFPDQSFFGKFFKKHTGLSPSAFRKE